MLSVVIGGRTFLQQKIRFRIPAASLFVQGPEKKNCGAAVMIRLRSFQISRQLDQSAGGNRRGRRILQQDRLRLPVINRYKAGIRNTGNTVS